MRLVTQVAVVAIIAGVGAGAWAYRDQLPFLTAKTATSAATPQVQRTPVETAKARTEEVRKQIDAVATTLANEAVTVTAKTAGIIRRINFHDGQKVPAGFVLVELDAGESQAKIDEMRSAVENARANLDRANQLLSTNNVAKAKVDELKTTFSAAEARLRAEQAKFSDYMIKAPFGGKIGLRNISLGALIRPGDVVTTLDDISIIKLEFDVTEADFGTGQVRVGRTVHATGAGIPGQQIEGKVTAIDTRLDPVTRTVRVRAEIQNGDEVLKPGMFMNARLVLERRPDAVVVPEQAILSRGSDQFVYIVRDGVAHMTPVTLGQRMVGKVEIAQGVKAGDDVVTAGLQQVRDKAQVRQATAANEQPKPASGQPPAQPGQPQPAKPKAG
ncbi:MAG: efflux RND transporter periplasmic adaptor subunit [Alphaproteobacteria bacterium]|jgi:membrane fusion protein (multidrug efflux system)|nr:efflux RND transporter periplasmic adaptor subunit [Alphaproteobacteria bacterium]